MRYFAAVAEFGSFTRAAQELHVAQQAVSQQIKALEQLLGVRLLERSSRRVTVTPEGVVFLADCRRVLAGADRAAHRVRAAARGEAGTLRLVYTLVSAFETVPLLLDRLDNDYPLLRVDAREVFGADVAGLLRDGACDLALAPLTTYPDDLRQRTIRREVVRVAVADGHRLAARKQIELRLLRRETLELWPHEMAPGYFDAVIAACRAAGFEPKLDQHGAGSTVWRYIARGRGVGLVVSSLIEQLPRGVKLVNLAPPRPMLTVNAVWRPDDEPPTIERFFEAQPGSRTNTAGRSRRDGPHIGNGTKTLRHPTLGPAAYTHVVLHPADSPEQTLVTYRPPRRTVRRELVAELRTPLPRRPPRAAGDCWDDRVP
jgi:DNA-binding transcriptional LysR family regulator